MSRSTPTHPTRTHPTRGWSTTLLTVLTGAVAVVLSSIAGSPAAYAEAGWNSEMQGAYTPRRGSSRAASGYSDAPEVAARPRRARSTRVVRTDDDDTPRVRSSRRTRVAHLKSSNQDDSSSGGYSARPKVGGGHVSWVASGGCLPGSLRSVIAGASQYGSVTVSSTGRSHASNRAAGGAQHSYHLNCQAADFRVHGNVASAASYLRNHGSVGGFHHYGGGLFHIDTGPKRTW